MTRIVARAVAIVTFLISTWSTSACYAQPAPSAGVHWTWGTLPEEAEMSAISGPVIKAYSARDFVKLDGFEAEYRDSKGDDRVRQIKALSILLRAGL